MNAVRSERQIMCRAGDDWIIDYDGKTCRVRDARGMQHLYMLLTHPHEEISALILERCGAGADEIDGAQPVALHDSRERARVNVTRAIAFALQHIAEQYPALHAHLAATLQTGIFCCYTPDPRVPLRCAG